MRLIFLSLLLVSSVSVQSAEDYVVKFGILENRSGQFSLLVETSVLPLIPVDKGLYFGVEISPESNDPYVIDLVAKLPGEPKKLSGVFEGTTPRQAQEGLTFPSYKLTGVSTIPMGFDEGDPLGIYTLEVYANKNLIKTIEYQAIDDPNLTE
ncbi:MAG: hypothetical protein V2J89_05745 [Halieaceae bacterium]|jgi:hypothetical protein|nr:hypothetical protein [Halieaceae bacterium]